jgi:hypothetical protein
MLAFYSNGIYAEYNMGNFNLAQTKLVDWLLKIMFKSYVDCHIIMYANLKNIHKQMLLILNKRMWMNIKQNMERMLI